MKVPLPETGGRTNIAIGRASYGKSLLLSLADGVAQTLCAAAPAGFWNTVSNLRVTNANVGAVIVTVTEVATGNIVLKASIAGASSSQPTTSNLALPSASALTILATGGAVIASGDLLLADSAVDIVSATLVLTNALQTLPLTVPAGMLAKLVSAILQGQLGSPSPFMSNADSAPATLITRRTRGAIVENVTNTATAANARLTLNLPTLGSTDVLEARLSVAPVVAGSVVLCSTWQLYREAP